MYNNRCIEIKLWNVDSPHGFGTLTFSLHSFFANHHTANQKAHDSKQRLGVITVKVLTSQIYI